MCRGRSDEKPRRCWSSMKEARAAKRAAKALRTAFVSPWETPKVQAALPQYTDRWSDELDAMAPRALLTAVKQAAAKVSKVRVHFLMKVAEVFHAICDDMLVYRARVAAQKAEAASLSVEDTVTESTVDADAWEARADAWERDLERVEREAVGATAREESVDVVMAFMPKPGSGPRTLVRGWDDALRAEVASCERTAADETASEEMRTWAAARARAATFTLARLADDPTDAGVAALQARYAAAATEKRQQALDHAQRGAALIHDAEHLTSTTDRARAERIEAAARVGEADGLVDDLR